MTDFQEEALNAQFDDAIDILKGTGHEIVCVRRPAEGKADTCIVVAYGEFAAELDAAVDRLIGRPLRKEVRAI